MSVLSGGLFLIEVETAPNVWTECADLTRVNKANNATINRTRVFRKTYRSASITERVLTLAGLLNYTDPGQAALLTAERTNSTIRVRYAENSGTTRKTMVTVNVSTVTHDANPDPGELQTITYELRTSEAPATVGLIPTTPEELVSAFNAIDPNVQIEHGFAPGIGHSAGSGQKADIVDFVGGGADGVLHMVPSVGAGGLYYDAVAKKFKVNNGSTYASSKVVVPNDLKTNLLSRFTLDFVFLDIQANINNGRFIHTHDGIGYSQATASGGNVWGIPGFADGFGGFWENVPVNNGTYQEYGTGRRPVRVAQWYVFDHGHDATDLGDVGYKDAHVVGANGEQWRYFNRDWRCWHQGTDITQSRTREMGGEPNPGGGTAVALGPSWESQGHYIGKGTPSAAHYKLAMDYAVAQLGYVEDVRPLIVWGGNSIGSLLSPYLRQSLIAAAKDVPVCDTAMPGQGRLDILRDRGNRVEKALLNSHRPYRIVGCFEARNILGHPSGLYTPTSAADLVVSVTQDWANQTGDRPFLMTMTPQVTDATGETNRQTLNARLRSQATALGIPLIDTGADSNYWGIRSAADNVAYYADGLHPTSAVCVDIAAYVVARMIALNLIT